MTLFEFNCFSVFYPVSGTQNMAMNARTVVSGFFFERCGRVFDRDRADKFYCSERMDGYDESVDTYSLLYKAPEVFQWQLVMQYCGNKISKLRATLVHPTFSSKFPPNFDLI